MKPKDALGELVKEWRKLGDAQRNDNFSEPYYLMAAQLEKALEGKVVIEQADFAWLMSGAKDVPMTEKSKEEFSRLMIKYRFLSSSNLPKETA